MWQETSPGEWKKVAGPPKKVNERWKMILEICNTCDDYIQPSGNQPRGHCRIALIEGNGKKCEAVFRGYVVKCIKQVTK